MRFSLSAVIVISLIVVSMERNSYWINDGTIWSDSINKSPGNARGYNELGLHAVQNKDYYLALQAFTRALQITPYLPQAYINIGLAYEGLGLPDRAMSAYETAISLSPNDPVAYYNLGMIYHRTKGNRDKAMQLYLKARDLDPYEPDVHQNLGVLYQDMGLYDQARREFELYRRLK